MRLRVVIGGVLAAVLAGACGAGSSGGGGGTRVEGASAAAGGAAHASSAAPAGPFVAFKDGTYEVGTGAGQVKPGTYKTTAGSTGCYWERLKGLSGAFEDIIANGNIDAGSPGIVTVKASDKGLRVNGGCEWKLSG